MAQQLGQVAVGTIVKLNENGSPVEFIVGRQNYESGLNGNGRTLLICIGSGYTMQWGPSSMSDPLYAASTVDTWLNTTYKVMLDAPIQEAMATTKFYYTPSGGASRSTLERAVFLCSATEFGFSNTGFITFNTEGSPLPEQVIEKLQYPPDSWTRTPSAQFSVIISTHGSAWVPVLGSKKPDDIHHVDPAFTLPSTLYVEDDGEISPIPAAPSSVDVPAQVMVGKPISISWSAVDGAVSYSLERNADSGGWSQIYSGANTSYTDTAGEWENAQYRVRAYANGVYSDYVTSETVPVAPLSALVISGSDGSLGTLTNDVQYVVSSSGTSALTVIESTGRSIRTFTATNGATIKIPVMDLPTGNGTIKITASTNPGSGVVTVTRNWTYSKTAPTFADTGSTAQLQQNGKNIFPLTLLECVRGAENLTPGGFGLGTVAVNISDLNDATKNGWYMNGAGGEAVHAPDNVAGWLVLVCAYSNDIVYQTAYRYGSDEGLISARRAHHNLLGGWQPWEWINPPTLLGVEYRTVERYNGKPVYMKLVDCGAGPNNTRKTVSANTQNVETPISCTGTFGNGTIPYEWFAGDSSGAQAITCTFSGQEINIAATADYSRWTVFVILKYTKTTD